MLSPCLGFAAANQRSLLVLAPCLGVPSGGCESAGLGAAVSRAALTSPGTAGWAPAEQSCACLPILRLAGRDAPAGNRAQSTGWERSEPPPAAEAISEDGETAFLWKPVLRLTQ